MTVFAAVKVFSVYFPSSF